MEKNSNIIAKATIDKADLSYQNTPVIVFALYNGTTPVAINAVKMNVETTADLQSTFSGTAGNLVKVFVFSGFELDITTSPNILANTIRLQ